MPRGVYPRRKLGRPAKAAAKPAAKPASIREQYKTLYDFFAADSECMCVDNLHIEACKSKNSLENDVRGKTFEIQRLLIARDLVMQGSSEMDYPESSVDEVLKASTGNDSEMWGGMLIGAVNDLTDLITSKCVDIADLAKQRDQKVAEIKDLVEKLNDRRDTLREQWDAAEEPKEADG